MSDPLSDQPLALYQTWERNADQHRAKITRLGLFGSLVRLTYLASNKVVVVTGADLRAKWTRKE